MTQNPGKGYMLFLIFLKIFFRRGFIPAGAVLFLWFLFT